MLRIPNEAHGDIEWTKFVLEELSEPVWPPREPLLTLVERLENIVQSFHAHSYLWTELDIRMRDVDYAWNDISAWPLDVWNPLVYWHGTDLHRQLEVRVQFGRNPRHLRQSGDNCGVHASVVWNACQGGAIWLGWLFCAAWSAAVCVPAGWCRPQNSVTQGATDQGVFAYLVESVLPTLVSTSLQVAAGTFGRAVPLFWGAQPQHCGCLCLAHHRAWLHCRNRHMPRAGSQAFFETVEEQGIRPFGSAVVSAGTWCHRRCIRHFAQK